MGDLDFDFIPMFNSVGSQDEEPSIQEARTATTASARASESILPPWLSSAERLESTYNQQDFTLGLHEEILDYLEYVSPSEQERKLREELVDRVKSITYKVFPLCEIDIFGSFQTGLYLQTSDIDLVVKLKERIPRYLHILAAEIEKSKMATQIEVIDSARVPIVKFMDKKTQITVDICFNNSTAVEAAPLIAERLDGLPALKALVMVMKHFLFCRRLNETYYGGIGSFVLFLMVSNFLRVILINVIICANISFRLFPCNLKSIAIRWD
jgi:non-canonical poly(A) RNA polymerase PAPD5/7